MSCHTAEKGPGPPDRMKNTTTTKDGIEGGVKMNEKGSYVVGIATDGSG